MGKSNIFNCMNLSEFYEGADALILVAMASQRMLLISNKEESQVGKAYLQAKEENGRLHTLHAAGYVIFNNNFRRLKLSI